MTVALIGGFDRLKHHYQSTAKERGINLRILTTHTSDLSCKLAQVDAVIMFTDLVSHNSAKKVYKLTRTQNVCLVCSHNSSLTAIRRCLHQVKKMSRRRSAENPPI